jgi:hypothetical protein
LQPIEINEGIRFAPREGNRTLSLFLDQDAEELSFPSIYFGQKHKVTKNMSVRDLAKSELRRKDRHCAGSVSNIFYKHRTYCHFVSVVEQQTNNNGSRRKPTLQ